MCTLDALSNLETADLNEEFVAWAEKTLGERVFGYWGFAKDRTKLYFTAVAMGAVEIGQFCLTDFPGAPLLISSDLFVHPKYRGKGVAQKFMEMKVEICRRINDFGLLCTVNPGNLREIHILQKTGWQYAHPLVFGQIDMWYKPVA